MSRPPPHHLFLSSFYTHLCSALHCGVSPSNSGLRAFRLSSGCERTGALLDKCAGGWVVGTAERTMNPRDPSSKSLVRMNCASALQRVADKDAPKESRAHRRGKSFLLHAPSAKYSRALAHARMHTFTRQHFVLFHSTRVRLTTKFIPKGAR